MARRVFVTGVSSGIGRALTTALVAQGDEVWGIARRTEQLEALARELPPGRFRRASCDVTDDADVLATARTLQAQQFVPDVVVLNAGINRRDLLPAYDHRQYLDVFQTNLVGAMVWVREFLPIFARRGHGQFMAISSISAYLTHGRGAAYGASKAALTSTFLSLQKRYAKDGVTFTTVHLGPVNTAMWSGRWFPLLLSEQAVVRRLIAAMDRRAALVEIPRSVAWLARGSQLCPGLLLPKAAHSRARSA